jgi:hypothetical protein
MTTIDYNFGNDFPHGTTASASAGAAACSRVVHPAACGLQLRTTPFAFRSAESACGAMLCKRMASLIRAMRRPMHWMLGVPAATECGALPAQGVVMLGDTCRCGVTAGETAFIRIDSELRMRRRAIAVCLRKTGPRLNAPRQVSQQTRLLDSGSAAMSPSVTQEVLGELGPASVSLPHSPPARASRSRAARAFPCACKAPFAAGASTLASAVSRERKHRQDAVQPIGAAVCRQWPEHSSTRRTPCAECSWCNSKPLPPLATLESFSPPPRSPRKLSARFAAAIPLRPLLKGCNQCHQQQSIAS